MFQEQKMVASFSPEDVVHNLVEKEHQPIELWNTQYATHTCGKISLSSTETDFAIACIQNRAASTGCHLGFCSLLQLPYA
jgi:hypothetical protein